MSKNNPKLTWQANLLLGKKEVTKEQPPVGLVKGLSYSYFNAFGILIIFYMFFLYTCTFQKSKIQMGEAPLFLIY